ncbi:putative cleavage and polyadenylation specificity factor [Trypanosoma rangeli]|uniref:Putative cleavage and polyadenylation specificity factor n=1 Tax=Trypanosoma rangeli TaxID=5698 RepID=A0A422NEN5_TRYRA|nr:putative cleavage and polyadenylation specificity factor [Trypanosoma rangeli]RNF03926.1 putative cleavage and polyadenylation specificity factor [Trypanosoma rangeli]|eukprot:RNF03926.1 putative cleavage and polyadenylation specificity factor [Trypanosoma rangeli]
MLPATAAAIAAHNKSTGSVLDNAFRDSDVPVSASSDEVEILPIGSGGEVGRSCVILRYKGRSVMLDCGNHPAKSGLDSLPFFDSIRCDEIDVVLITHFHLDHCGALPYFCEQTAFKGRVFMTSATKAFYKMVMNDFLRVGASANDIVTNEWLQSTIEKIETVEYHEEVTVNGIRFQPFNAGHVLGAALFMVDIAGMKALYTGDFSRVPDRHLLGAEVPTYSPDILIAESTNGIRELESREERETLFTTWVHDVVKGGGRCLVPVFALGRAQELLLILEEYWEGHKELQHIPIYYASSLAQRCMKLYQTFVSAMNDRVKQQHANHRNPFVFKYIHSLVDTRSFEDTGPCVVLASPGMLQSGISLELFERWCGDRRNGIIVAGYCVDGTIAKDILAKPKEVTKPDGRVLPLRMRTIQSVSFSAHSDGRQTRDFIQALPKTQHVILVHGNVGAMGQLKNKLQQDFAERGMKVYSTKNQEAIRIPFTVQRTAKVMGALATVPARNGDFVSGALLVSGKHSYSIVHPIEIPLFTDLNVAQIQQAMVLPLPRYKSALEVLEVLQRYFAQSQMFEGVTPQQQDVVPEEINGREVDHTTSTTRITVCDNVSVDVQQSARSQTTLTITWTSSHRNDLIADVTCIALTKIMHIEHGTDSTDPLPVEISGSDRIFRLKCFHHMMSQFYPSVITNLGTGVCTLELEDGQTAIITDCIEIELEDNKKANYFSADVERLKTILKRVYLTLFPIPVDQGWCDCGMIHGAEPLPEEAV